MTPFHKRGNNPASIFKSSQVITRSVQFGCIFTLDEHKKKLLYSRLLIEGCHYQLKEVRENLKLTMLAIFLEIQKVEE
jgi:hypothetical protein